MVYALIDHRSGAKMFKTQGEPLQSLTIFDVIYLAVFSVFDINFWLRCREKTRTKEKEKIGHHHHVIPMDDTFINNNSRPLSAEKSLNCCKMFNPLLATF